MKKLLISLVAGLLAVVACPAQPTNTDISIPEFRQALMDFAVDLDAAQGSNLAMQVQGVPDSTLLKWYQGVPNGRAFQGAVADARARKLAARLLGRPRTGGGPSMVASTDSSLLPP